MDDRYPPQSRQPTGTAQGTAEEAAALALLAEEQAAGMNATANDKDNSTTRDRQLPTLLRNRIHLPLAAYPIRSPRPDDYGSKLYLTQVTRRTHLTLARLDRLNVTSSAKAGKDRVSKISERIIFFI